MMAEEATLLRGTELSPGQIIGAYRTLRLLGRGGMGTVYEAEQTELGTRVAVKLMNGSLGGHATATARFFREARAIAKLQHPHIVRFLDLGVDARAPFIVMELLDGEALNALLARERRLSLERVIALFLPLLSAVSTIHAAGIVHRDLKPGNVFLARRSGDRVDPVVLDFGISRLEETAHDDTSLTRSAGLLGTTRYLSPEQVQNAKHSSPLSDQYAIGVMLYECATGTVLFQGKSAYEVMHAILTLEVPPPSAFVHELPAAFDAIVLRAMSREPGARFRDVRELGEALLSLGNTREWSDFAREFVSLDREQTSSGTEPDLRSEPDRPRPNIAARRRGRARYVTRALLSALAVASAGAAAVALDRRAESVPLPVVTPPPAARALTLPVSVSVVAPPPPIVDPAATMPIPELRRPIERTPRWRPHVAKPKPAQVVEPGADDAIDPFATSP